MKNNKSKDRLVMIIALVILFTIFFCIFIVTNNNRIENWHFQQELNQITNIYLVDVRSEEEYEIIKEISIEKKDNLIYDLSNVNYRTNAKKGTPVGIGFLIKYYDESYEIITQKYPCFCKYENSMIKTNYSKYYSLDDEFYRIIVNYYK